jgi:hypothetical protein
MRSLRPPVLLPLLLAAGLLAAVPAGSQGFGRNKVQYDTFDWRVLVTEHLEIHFYPEEEEVARRAAEYGEVACARLDAELDHELTRRIPVVVYGSHYHFRQNNVSPSIIDESTGGFTEIFRTRVVLPYSGSEPDFRHVIHHELVHAYMFDILYGGPVRSLFVLQHAFHIPLWFAEGIAEYYSNRWDSEAEMMIRDAAVSGTLPPFSAVGSGYFVYKTGWSAIGYLVQRHGDDVVRRILHELPGTRDLRVAVENVTGEDVEKIGTEWLKDVRRATWPTYAYLGEPESVGRMLTKDDPNGGLLNGSPGLSPSGSRVVFLSDRSGTPDLWVLDVDDEAGKPRVLVRGARTGEFESLHPLRSSVGWSPDERFVVVAAQKGARDALYVLDVATGRARFEHVPDLDALERPDWSPTDARFVFTGMKNGQVDLYVVDADGTNLRRLTDDLHQERGPRWSPDGRRIAFASDRSDSTGRDLWEIDAATGEARPLRIAPGDQWDPDWSADGRHVFHVSDEQGTRDLMRTSRADGGTRRLTALLGGVDSPSAARAGGRLVFTAFHGGRWDLVLVEDADSLDAVDAPPVELPDVPWRTRVVADPGTAEPAEVVAAEDAPLPDPAADPYVTPYRARFRPEWVTGAFAYDGFGVSGAIQSTLSDVLGNHRVHAGARVFRSLSDSDGILSYSYLPRRLDWGISVFHVKDYLHDHRTTFGQPIGEEGERAFFSERQWGAMGSVAYPFHTFRRISLDVTAVELERILYTEESRRLGAKREEASRARGRILLPRIAHTFDNTLWGWTGPVQGARSVVSVQHSIPLGGDDLLFGTAAADGRLYRRFSQRYVLALRGMAAASFGRNPQQFQLGGPNTIRGHPRQEFRGRNAAVVSAEFRYPFLDYVKLGWPFRSSFGGVRGNLFVDVGTAFDGAARFRLAGDAGDGRRGLDDLKVGFGVGTRARFAFLPVRLDIGWPTDLARVGSPRWHFTIGPEY